VSRLERLDALYGEHQAKRDEFVFGSDERAALFARLVGGPGLRVLDLGCRAGALTAHFAPGNEVVGCDVDRGALELAAERLSIETHWLDVEDAFPFEDATFDVVVAGELFEHLAQPKLAVAEAHRVLVPGGRLVGSVPNAFRLKSRIRFAFGRHPETDATHLQLFTPAMLRGLLSGFASVELTFAVGRYLRWSPRLMGRVQVFVATKSSD
jgi:SAM-dependent methyltransferase